ncbi:hypothetical protein PPL_12342 [Heterostelium album PN500]|uniref:Uncharacterized protein n=1 Tax=Heterostelium pallidum (strain ATCC 26659 / Pp 5 / PN500) TaxID=670386 RepID=D3BMC9_HETP5|nr:hypothetical protein PPL_12342 [Heterostelium album PN500]EFA77730.1 hypothetical protein PPL_12342 [Heterostelium album PN500]|eukprot:XP_020429858.1 hypothetical protein PPL_12342 [Heterostelium album PN500]
MESTNAEESKKDEKIDKIISIVPAIIGLLLLIFIFYVVWQHCIRRRRINILDSDLEVGKKYVKDDLDTLSESGYEKKKSYQPIQFYFGVPISIYIARDTEAFFPEFREIIAQVFPDASVICAEPPLSHALNEIGVILYPVFVSGARVNASDYEYELTQLESKYGNRYEIIFTCLTYGANSNIKGLHRVIHDRFKAISLAYSSSRDLCFTNTNENSLNLLKETFENEISRYNCRQNINI